MCFESDEIAIHVRVAKLVIEDDDREINVEICSNMIGVILPDAGREAQLVCVGCERVPMEEADIDRLLCFGILDVPPRQLPAQKQWYRL